MPKKEHAAAEHGMLGYMHARKSRKTGCMVDTMTGGVTGLVLSIHGLLYKRLEGALCVCCHTLCIHGRADVPLRMSLYCSVAARSSACGDTKHSSFSCMNYASGRQ